MSVSVFHSYNNGTCHKQTGFYFHCGEKKFNIPVLLNPKEKKIRFNLTEGMLLRLTKYENRDTRFPDSFCATLFFHFHFENSINIHKNLHNITDNVSMYYGFIRFYVFLSIT